MEFQYTIISDFLQEDLPFSQGKMCAARIFRKSKRTPVHSASGGKPVPPPSPDDRRGMPKKNLPPKPLRLSAPKQPYPPVGTPDYSCGDQTFYPSAASFIQPRAPGAGKRLTVFRYYFPAVSCACSASLPSRAAKASAYRVRASSASCPVFCA